MTLTDKEIAIVKDTANDTPTMKYVGTPLDTEGPIDFEAMKAAIGQLGPLRMRSKGGPYSIELHMLKCACEEEGCSHDIIAVVRRNGVFSIRWMLSPEEVMGFDSIEHLKDSALAGYFLDTCLERQAIEQDVERLLGEHYMDVKPMTCFCEACAEAVGKDELPLHMLLSQMASNLTARVDHIEECVEAFGQDVETSIEDAFDLGYQLGRLNSEYQVKRDIEGHAMAGMNFEAAQAKRAHGAGTKSSGKRIERMTSLLTFMEQLAADSPALMRIGLQGLARMACEDASAADPALWSQGSGQVDEYLGLIRRGEAGKDLQARYFALFPPRRPPHQKTA
jgi:hypothetical protein